MLLSISLFSCKNHEDEEPEVTNQVNEKQPNKEYEEDIEILFDSPSNTSSNLLSIEDSLLRAIKICNPNEVDMKNYQNPPCDMKFFNIMPTISKKNIRDGFLVLCKSGVAGFPMRRILVYDREGSDYVLANTFLGDVIGMETSKESTHKDLIIQFMDEDMNRFECRYVWKQGRYSYNQLLKINRSKVKAEFRDSMTVVIAGEIKRMKLSY